MNYKTLEDVERVVSLGKKDSVISMFVESYLQGLEYESWYESHKEVHAAIPAEIDSDEPIIDEDEIVIGYVQIANPVYLSFTEYMQETEEVEVGVEDILDETGEVIGTEPILVSQRIRQYAPVVVDVDQWKIDNYKILREANYPSVNEFLDAWVQDDQVALEAYRTKCLDNKAKFKKVK